MLPLKPFVFFGTSHVTAIALTLARATRAGGRDPRARNL